MKELIEWLIGIEHMAGEIYKNAAGVFKNDKHLVRFLYHLAEDEAWHFMVMGSAADLIKREPLAPSNLALDRAFKTRIEDPCLKIREKLASGALTKESLLDYIATIEFSEWNYFFLYIVNALREKRREYEYAASKIEYHKKYISRFIENQPNNRTYLTKMQHLPKVWDARILIIEDFKPLRILLSQLLSTEGIVETADNGELGLRKIGEHYYDIILVSDLMPCVSSTEFYKKAVKHDPLIAKRLVFLVDSMTSGSLDFLQKNNLRYLIKPFPMHEVKEVMHSVLAATPNKKQISILLQSIKKKESRDD
jgi:CheY-like chemotaxis protein